MKTFKEWLINEYDYDDDYDSKEYEYDSLGRKIHNQMWKFVGNINLNDPKWRLLKHLVQEVVRIYEDCVKSMGPDLGGNDIWEVVRDRIYDELQIKSPGAAEPYSVDEIRFAILKANLLGILKPNDRIQKEISKDGNTNDTRNISIEYLKLN